MFISSVPSLVVHMDCLIKICFAAFAEFYRRLYGSSAFSKLQAFAVKKRGNIYKLNSEWNNKLYTHVNICQTNANFKHPKIEAGNSNKKLHSQRGVVSYSLENVPFESDGLWSGLLSRQAEHGQSVECCGVIRTATRSLWKQVARTTNSEMAAIRSIYWEMDPQKRK